MHMVGKSIVSFQNQGVLNYTLCFLGIVRVPAKRKEKVDKHFRKLCPIAGCPSRPQKKLSQHLDYKHPELVSRKKHFLKMAKRIPYVRQSTPKTDQRQPTLKQVLGSGRHNLSPDEESGESDVMTQALTEGTRHFPHFDMKHPSFVHYLTGLDGGSRSEKTATEMAVDVSKYLMYACGSSCPHPGWERLTDRDQLTGFMEKLKRSSVGPEGQLAKLDAVVCTLRFLKVVVLRGESSSPLFQQACHMSEVLSGWKVTLRRDKRKLRIKRLEELSCQDLSLDEVNALLDNAQMWKTFDTTCMRANLGETISTRLLNECSVILASSILYKNWQRPGAVCNATVEEFKSCKLVVRGSDAPVYVMAVRDHKTAQEGYAKLVLQTTDHARIIQYNATTRKLLDAGSSSPLLFLLCGGGPLSNLSSRIKKLFQAQCSL